MKASPAPTVSLTTTCGAGAVTSVPRSHKAAPSSASVTQMREVFVASATIAQADGNRFRSARRVRGPLAGLQPGSQSADFAVIELQNVGALRQLHDQVGIGEGRAQVHVEKFHRTLNRQQTLELLEIVRGAARERPIDQRARFRDGRERFRRNFDLIPRGRLHQFVGGIGVCIQGHQHRARGKADARAGDKLCVDSFVLRHFQNLVAQGISADAGKERRGDAELSEMRGDIERSSTGMPARRQAIPKDFPKGVILSSHS